MQKIHYSTKTILLNVSSAVFVLVVTAPVVVGPLLLFPLILQSRESMVQFLLAPLLLLLSMAVLLDILLLTNLVTLWFANYIRVSPTEIEFSQIYGTAMRCNWKDAQTITRAPQTLLRTSVVFRDGQWLGSSLRLRLIQKLGQNPFVIPISLFSGWENGDLKKQIQQYAPTLIIENK